MMNRQSLFIAWILIVEAACGIAALAWTMRQGALPGLIWGVFSPLIAGALAAGVGLLLHRTWARWLALFVIAAQIPVLSTPTFQYSLWIGTHLDVVAALQDDARVGVNVLALCMLVWCLYCFNTNDDPSDEARSPTNPIAQPDA